MAVTRTTKETEKTGHKRLKGERRNVAVMLLDLAWSTRIEAKCLVPKCRSGSRPGKSIWCYKSDPMVRPHDDDVKEFIATMYVKGDSCMIQLNSVGLTRCRRVKGLRQQCQDHRRNIGTPKPDDVPSSNRYAMKSTVPYRTLIYHLMVVGD